MKGTIKSNAEIERLFDSGRKLNTKAVILIVRATPERRGQAGRVAFIAGKKLGNAPARSRAKRIMREVCRELGGPVAGYDMVFLARREVLDSPHGKIVEDCRRQLERAGVYTAMVG